MGVSKNKCIACQGGIFVGDVLDVRGHLCSRHLQEDTNMRTKEITTFLQQVDMGKGVVQMIKTKKYRHCSLPLLNSK